MLPPAYEERGKVIFSLCLSIHRVGEYPSSRFFPKCLVPGPFQGAPQEVPSQSQRGSQSQLGGAPERIGIPPDWDLGTHLRLGTPLELGYPPAGTGVSPPPETEQESKHLLCSGRYASCGHAGGPPCFMFYYCTTSQSNGLKSTSMLCSVLQKSGFFICNQPYCCIK